MKRYLKLFILLCAAFVATSLNVRADDSNQKESRQQWIQTQAREIASELGLNEATTQKFITVFCQSKKEIWECRPEKGNLRHKKGTTLTDAEAEQILKNRFEHQRKLNDIQEKYYREYSKFLTQRQILQAQDIERRMMDRLFKQHDNKPDSKSGDKRTPKRHPSTQRR